MGRSSTTRKSAPRDAASKLAQQRLSVIELAKGLGNVAEACRQRGLDRTSFLRMEAAVSDAGLRGAERSAADPQVAPADDPAGDGGPGQGAGIGALGGFSISLPAAAAQALEHDPRVAVAAREGVREIVAQTIPMEISRTFAPGNGSIMINGIDEVRVDADVAIIDSGIDLAHV